MTTDVFFNENKTYTELEQWLNTNILHEAHDLVELLFEKELVMYDDIENFYKSYDRDEFEDEEDYIKFLKYILLNLSNKKYLISLGYISIK